MSPLSSVRRPAISVLSAVEGIGVATPAFESYVMPLTIVILIGLFAIQPFGSARVGATFGDIGLSLGACASSLAISPPHRVPGTAVFMADQNDSVPTVLLHHLKHNQVLHETVIVLSIVMDEAPRVMDAERIRIERVELGVMQIVARIGYMEEPNVPDLLVLSSGPAEASLYDPMTTSFYLGRESLVSADRLGGSIRGMCSHGNLLKRGLLHLFIRLHKNERDATSYFGIPPNRVVELGARLELTS